MRILVCPMAFKGTLTARQAAGRIPRAFARERVKIRKLPFADGGDGTAEILHGSLGGSWRIARLTGPLGRRIGARWLWIPGKRLAVADAASICGYALLPAVRRDPMRPTSRGLGEFILRASDAGAKEIWIGLGGTATVDGGIGALSALGVRFLDASGKPVGEGGAALAKVARIDRSKADPRLKRVRIRLVCDVRSPLLGPRGAARMFGPQKGASRTQIMVLECGMRVYARVILRDFSREVARLEGAGAAGGIAAGFADSWRPDRTGAPLLPARPGWRSRSLGGPRRHREGRLDAQTLREGRRRGLPRPPRRPVLAVVEKAACRAANGPLGLRKAIARWTERSSRGVPFAFK